MSRRRRPRLATAPAWAGGTSSAAARTPSATPASMSLLTQNLPWGQHGSTSHVFLFNVRNLSHPKKCGACTRWHCRGCCYFCRCHWSCCRRTSCARGRCGRPTLGSAAGSGRTRCGNWAPPSAQTLLEKYFMNSSCKFLSEFWSTCSQSHTVDIA